MYSQSKGRQFTEGEQRKLVEYLIQTCPLDPDQETEQDRKLNLILSKVQEHQSSLRLTRSSSSDLKKLSVSSPRRNSGTDSMSSSMTSSMMMGMTSSTPSSQQSTPVNTPASVRRHSSASSTRGVRGSRARSSPTPRRSAMSPARASATYKMELPPTLYGEDLVNGNTELMTQSMDPAVLGTRLDNESSPAMMSQSVDSSMLGETAASYQQVPARPRTLFSNRGSTDSGIRYSTVQYSTVQYSTVYSTAQYQERKYCNI